MEVKKKKLSKPFINKKNTQIQSELNEDDQMNYFWWDQMFFLYFLMYSCELLSVHATMNINVINFTLLK